jgi:hypothetical protein
MKKPHFSGKHGLSVNLTAKAAKKNALTPFD